MAAAVARPVLDRRVERIEDRFNPVWPHDGAPVSDAAAALHATLRIGDLHADSLLFGRDLLQWGAVGHVDVPRLIEGRIALQVLSMAVKTPATLNYDRNDDRTDEIRKLALAKRWPPSTWFRLLPRVAYLAGQAWRLEERSGGRFRVVTSSPGLAAYLALRERDPRITAGLLSIEGAHALDGDPGNVDVVADMGVRMISPAHFFDTEFGGSAHGVEQGGLTAKGREMIRRMEARGVVLDVAHASPATVDDCLAVATRPVVASHTGLRALVESPRNLTDEQVRGIAATGGLVGIGFWDAVVGGRTAADVARTIIHAVGIAGAPHVALGSDWDGSVGVPFDAAGVVRLTDALLAAGMGEDDIRLVMGENVLRVLADALPAG
jgi:microsomal dipeptidase-like Zn-dependent dipeptidase